jgi:hypothetical protein
VTLAEVFADAPAGTVTSGGTTNAGGVSGTAESWTVSVTSAFAALFTGSQHFYAADKALPGEVFEVTACPGGTGSQSWTVVRGADGTVPVAHSAGFTVVQVASAGTLKTLQRQPWQFWPEDYGAKGDGAFLYDVAISASSATLTTVGLPAPSAPTVNNSGSGGTVLAGTYQVKITYVNQYGETLPSSATSTTTTGSTSTITVVTPGSWTNATGYYVYCTQAGGAAFTRQQPPGSPTQLGVNFVISAPPSSGGANPPGANTSASSPFKSADAGKVIVVPDAGGGPDSPLCTTIQAYNSATSVTLAATASSSVTSYGAVYGTDDTTAWQNCLNAAVAYGQGSEQGIGEVVAGNKMYCIGGAKQTTIGGNNYWYTQLAIPYVQSYAGPKVQLKITGPVEASGPVHWNQPNPQADGTVLACMRGDGVYTGDQQATSVLGGPTNGFGGANGVYSNLRLVVDGLNFLVPYGPTYAGLDAYGLAQASIRSMGYFCMARTTVGSAGGWPVYINGGYTGSWRTFGYRPPSPGNNAQSDCDRLTVYGPWEGFFFGDHFIGGSIKILFCVGAGFPYTGPAGSLHHSYIASLLSEGTAYPLYAPTSGQFAVSGGNECPVTIGILHLENDSAVLNDSGNVLYGQILGGEQGATLQPAVTGGANMKLFWSTQPPGKVASPPSVPATTVAYTNAFGRDATLIVSGGTVTAIAVDTVTTGLTSGPVYVRNGGTITLTYSVAPSWNWVLG